jgi:hypothetical protein
MLYFYIRRESITCITELYQDKTLTAVLSGHKKGELGVKRGTRVPIDRPCFLHFTGYSHTLNLKKLVKVESFLIRIALQKNYKCFIQRKTYAGVDYSPPFS